MIEERNEWIKRSVSHKRQKIAHAKKGADGRHGQRNGNRDRKQMVIAEWHTGKYPTRDACAAAVAPKIGLTAKAARRHLIGVPKPAVPQ